MAYSLVTSVADYDALLGELKTFATGTPGWTAVFDSSADNGIRQLGLEKGNCHMIIGGRSGDVAIARTPGTDTILSMALCTGALVTTVGQRLYYSTSQPGNIVTSATDTDRVRVNDLGEGPFANVWFFSNAGGDKDYIHCVVQTSAERYTQFGFGIIDPVGMTHSDCAFVVGNYHEWWNTSGTCNNPADTSHILGHYIDQALNGILIYLPSGVVSLPATGVYNMAYLTGAMTRTNLVADHYANAVGKILDLFFAANNAPTTGGTAMYGTPVMIQETSSGPSHVMLGVLPGFRHANIGTHTPAEVTKYGSEDWMIFPLKRKGLRANLNNGSNPIAVANTAEYGLSFKKNP